MYICLEGIDGCGKSTLAHALYAYYHTRGKSVVLTKEPGSTSLGKQIRSIVQHAHEPIDIRAEFLLYAADRAQHYSEVIQPAHGHKIIISDRSYVSALAYQGYGRGLDISFITSVNMWALQNRVPDVFIYLRIDADEAVRRRELRAEEVTRFEQEKKDFFERVIAGYETIFKAYPHVIYLDAHKNKEVLLQESIERLRAYGL